jgi:hypothetical protein
MVDMAPKNRMGCVVVVRPDQYIAAVFPLNGHEELVEFFGRFMRVPSALPMQPTVEVLR